MRQRLISAAVLVPVVVIVFLLGDPWLTIGIALLGAAAGYECVALVRRAGLGADRLDAVAAPVIAVLAFVLLLPPQGVELGWLLILPAVGTWVVVTAIQALRHTDPRVGFTSWAGTLLASAYPSLLAFLVGILGLSAMGIPAGGAQPGLLGLDPGRTWLLVLVATVWTLDSAAYLAGRYHGRGRFMNHISPNKTWSGAIGGSIAAVVVCSALAYLAGVGLLAGALLGVVIALSAQAGDLAESMIKRAAGVKDSGNVLPGHGGILDRVDSFLFAAPAMYTALVVSHFLNVSGVL